MEDLVKKLEEQISFLQNEISQISDELYSQQKEVSILKKQISNVEKKINELENSDEADMVMVDKKPPHYLTLLLIHDRKIRCYYNRCRCCWHDERY